MPIPYTFVSLLDVLGYKNKINEDRQNGKEDFKLKLESSLSILSGVNETEISYQAISDTIIVSAHPSTPFSEFLSVLARVHRAFLLNGLFIRGGISFAPHFKSGLLTYSHALPVAYELEQKQAIYPRIVIDKNIIEMMSPGGKLESDAVVVKEKRLICRENGVYFLNVAGDSADACYALAKGIYESESAFLEGNEHELAKHRWLQNFILAISPSPLKPYMDGIEILFNNKTENSAEPLAPNYRFYARGRRNTIDELVKVGLGIVGVNFLASVIEKIDEDNGGPSDIVTALVHVGCDGPENMAQLRTRATEIGLNIGPNHGDDA